MNQNALLLAVLLLGPVQWDWAGVWIRAGWKIWLVVEERWRIEWCVEERRGQNYSYAIGHSDILNVKAR